MTTAALLALAFCAGMALGLVLKSTLDRARLAVAALQQGTPE